MPARLFIYAYIKFNYFSKEPRVRESSEGRPPPRAVLLTIPGILERRQLKSERARGVNQVRLRW